MTEARETITEGTAVAHNDMANAIRALAMDAVQAAKSGHPGMPMGMADVATVLFREALRFDAADPNWPNRDRFVLSAGHGSMLLYSLLYLTGYPGKILRRRATSGDVASRRSADGVMPNARRKAALKWLWCVKPASTAMALRPRSESTTSSSAAPSRTRS
jgi:hypothetical protein